MAPSHTSSRLLEHAGTAGDDQRKGGHRDHRDDRFDAALVHCDCDQCQQHDQQRLRGTLIAVQPKNADADDEEGDFRNDAAEHRGEARAPAERTVKLAPQPPEPRAGQCNQQPDLDAPQLATGKEHQHGHVEPELHVERPVRTLDVVHAEKALPHRQIDRNLGPRLRLVIRDT
jgi:hypothetical protein